jgi:hypothetical protein
VKTRLAVALVLGLCIATGCGGAAPTSSKGQASTTTEFVCPAGFVTTINSGSPGCVVETTITTATTTTAPDPHRDAFLAIVQQKGLGVDPSELDGLAQQICFGSASFSFGLAPVDQQSEPEVTRAAYEFKCPEKVPAFDAQAAAALKAMADQQRAQALAQDASGISADEFAQIKTGMTQAQVEAIVGTSGDVMSETDIAGYKGLVLSFKGEDGTSLGANAVVQFQNGRLILKSQFGL